MTRKLPTASSMDRGMRCAASLVRPRKPKDPNERPSQSKRRGTVYHAYINHQLNGGAPPDLGKFQIRCNMDQLRRQLIGFDDMQFDQAYEMAPDDTVTCLGAIEHRNYPERDPNCLYGTLDFQAINTFASIGIVFEIKTGWTPVVRPVDNAQTGFLSTCLAIVRPELERVRACIATLDRKGEWTFVYAEHDVKKLRDTSNWRAWREHWRSTIDAAEGGFGEPAPVPSREACMFCDCECSEKIEVFKRKKKDDSAAQESDWSFNGEEF